MENLKLEIMKLNGNVDSLGGYISGLRRSVEEHETAVSREGHFLQENTETLKKNNRLQLSVCEQNAISQTLDVYKMFKAGKINVDQTVKFLNGIVHATPREAWGKGVQDVFGNIADEVNEKFKQSKNEKSNEAGLN